MVIFYREAECSKCDLVQKGLKDMNLAHKVVTVTPDTETEMLLSGRTAPLLAADGEEIHGDDNIIKHLEVLERHLAQWHEHQSGCCFDSGE